MQCLGAPAALLDQREGFLVFQTMLGMMKENVLRRLFYYEVPTPEQFMKHIQEEEARRQKLEKQMQMVHPGTEGGEAQSGEELKDPEEQRKKLEAQKRARRKKRK